MPLNQKATVAAAKIGVLIIFVFTREKTPVFTTEATPLFPVKAEIFWESSKPHMRYYWLRTFGFITLCWPLRELKEEGINTLVVNNHTLKPMDEKQ